MRTRSTVSTAIMANTEDSRHKRMMGETQAESKSGEIEISPKHHSSSSNNKNSNNSASKQNKKGQSSLLDRLTIVNVETSSSKRRKGRRKHHRLAPRNDKPLPEELLLRGSLQDSISQMPDSFSNTFSKDEEIDTNTSISDHVPHLFTFDLVPSVSEDFSNTQRGEGTETDDSVANDTTDANIGEDEDISGIFDELEESDAKCVKDVEEKYCTKTNDNDTFKMNKIDDSSNMETLAALSKLELTSRTRTASTEFLSEVSSNDTSLHLEKGSTKISKPSKVVKRLQDETDLIAHEEFQIQASRCISFNMFSMFD